MRHYPGGIWACDFEFQREDNREHPIPVAFTALEINSGRTVRIFQEELRALRAAPFDTSERACMVAFSSGAEASCFSVLGWPTPANVIDPYAEHLLEMNGRPGRVSKDTSLIAALRHHDLPAMTAEYKEKMRDLVRFQNRWNEEERVQVLDYCMEDNINAAAVLKAQDTKGMNWEQALWRGRYLFASGGHIEHHGIPIDVATYERLQEGFPRLRHELIAADDKFHVFVDDHRNYKKCAELIQQTGLPWPRGDGGKYKLDNETREAMVRRQPKLEPWQKLLLLLDQLHHTKLAIGADGRNRFWTRPLLSKTGRNQPSTSDNIFGNAKWWRGLVTPPEGFAIVVIDWSGQEYVIAAGQSGCPSMRRACESGDIHMTTMILAGLVPEDATEETHSEERKQGKTLTHGSNYGITPFGIALRLNIPLARARSLLRAYDRIHRVFRSWQDDYVNRAYLLRRVTTSLGWSMYVDLSVGYRTIMNWPMQATGGEMLRAAVVMLIRAGFTICATSHDAVMLQVPLDHLDERVAAARQVMERVSLTFTHGIRVRTKPQIVLPGERLLDKETRPMWDQIMRRLGVRARALPELALSH